MLKPTGTEIRVHLDATPESRQLGSTHGLRRSRLVAWKVNIWKTVAGKCVAVFAFTHADHNNVLDKKLQGEHELCKAVVERVVLRVKWVSCRPHDQPLDRFDACVRTPRLQSFQDTFKCAREGKGNFEFL